MINTMILSPKSFAFPFSGDLVRNLSSFRMRQVPCGAFTFKVVVVGNPGVGKTSLVYRFTEGRVPAEYRPTIGVNILTKVMYLNATTQIKWIIWDTGDMGRLEYLRNALFKGAAAILFVFDKTNPTTLDALKTNWLNKRAKYGAELSRVPLVVIANKDDIAIQDMIMMDLRRNLMNENNTHLIETSTFTGKNVEGLFESLSYLCLPSRLKIVNF